MKKGRELSDETKAVHAGIEKDPLGAVVPPIYQTSTFEFKNVDEGAAVFAGEKAGYIYTRLGNPTSRALEKCVADLERGFDSIACSSGMAATHTVLVGVLKQGDHVICTNPVYGSTLTLLKTVASRFGVETTFIDTSSVPVVEKSFRANTRILFLETPANPTLAITDIAAMSELARRKSAVLVVDNTFASPIVQKPLTLGADIVVHSMTKYLNGHADVVAGIVVAKQQDLYDQLRTTLHNIGCNIDPHAAFLVHRGIKTLAVRMDRHCANAARVAAFLEKHPKIAWVRYPGLASHPHHELAMRQMKNGGGMVSLELKGGLEAGKVLMNSVQLCVLAVSLGGVETLIEHPASMTHCKVAPEDRERGCVSDGLVRLSIGIENVDDLIADLKQALDKI